MTSVTEHEKVCGEKFTNIKEIMKDHECRISDSEDKIVNMDKIFSVSIIGISKSLESLSKLPDAILALTETTGEMRVSMEKMQMQLKSNTEETTGIKNSVSDLKAEIKKIDEDGKINIREFIKKNWFGISVGVAGLLWLGTNLFELM